MRIASILEKLARIQMGFSRDYISGRVRIVFSVTTPPPLPNHSFLELWA